jgi:hypothetical protein
MATVIVTGASSGLGRELALLFAARGDTVHAVARSADALSELASSSDRILPMVADLASAAGRDALVAEVPSCDVLVNNAGFGSVGLFCELPAENSLSMIDVNVTALTDLTARYLPGMVARGRGRVLNVASTAAFQPGPRMAVYYATKAYVLSFTEAIAQELRPTGVTATAFCPGAFASGFQETAKADNLRLLKGRKLPDSASMARAALAAMDAGKVVAVPGALNKVGAAAPRFSPRPVVRRISEFVATEA